MATAFPKSRMLLVQSREVPRDAGVLDLHGEADLFSVLSADSYHAPSIVRVDGSYMDLQANLTSPDIRVVHITAHGVGGQVFLTGMPACPVGTVVTVPELAHWCTLLQPLAERRDPVVVTLAACDSSELAELIASSIASAVAPHAGSLFVIGFEGNIVDELLATWSRYFYTLLLAGTPVVMALQQTSDAIKGSGIPRAVLYGAAAGGNPGAPIFAPISMRPVRVPLTNLARAPVPAICTAVHNDACNDMIERSLRKCVVRNLIVGEAHGVGCTELAMRFIKFWDPRERPRYAVGGVHCIDCTRARSANDIAQVMYRALNPDEALPAGSNPQDALIHFLNARAHDAAALLFLDGVRSCDKILSLEYLPHVHDGTSCACPLLLRLLSIDKLSLLVTCTLEGLERRVRPSSAFNITLLQRASMSTCAQLFCHRLNVFDRTVSAVELSFIKDNVTVSEAEAGDGVSIKAAFAHATGKSLANGDEIWIQRLVDASPTVVDESFAQHGCVALGMGKFFQNWKPLVETNGNLSAVTALAHHYVAHPFFFSPPPIGGDAPPRHDPAPHTANPDGDLSVLPPPVARHATTAFTHNGPPFVGTLGHAASAAASPDASAGASGGAGASAEAAASAHLPPPPTQLDAYESVFSTRERRHPLLAHFAEDLSFECSKEEARTLLLAAAPNRGCVMLRRVADLHPSQLAIVFFVTESASDDIAETVLNPYPTAGAVGTVFRRYRTDGIVELKAAKSIFEWLYINAQNSRWRYRDLLLPPSRGVRSVPISLLTDSGFTTTPASPELRLLASRWLRAANGAFE